MPITLIDRRTERTLEVGDSTIRYYVADGAQALAEIRRGLHGLTAKELENDEGHERGVAAAVRLCARYVTGWTNVVSEDGQTIPWPGDGLAFGPGRSHPSADDLKLREGLLSNLPCDVLDRLDRAVAEGRQEASASGKDSPTGSGG